MIIAPKPQSNSSKVPQIFHWFFLLVRPVFSRQGPTDLAAWNNSSTSAVTGRPCSTVHLTSSDRFIHQLGPWIIHRPFGNGSFFMSIGNQKFDWKNRVQWNFWPFLKFFTSNELTQIWLTWLTWLTLKSYEPVGKWKILDLRKKMCIQIEKDCKHAATCVYPSSFSRKETRHPTLQESFEQNIHQPYHFCHHFLSLKNQNLHQSASRKHRTSTI